MKKFTTILISCSLALAAGAFAQQPEEQESPGKKKQPDKAHAASEEKAAPKAQTGPKEHAETKAPGQAKGAPKAQSTEAAGKPSAGTKAPATAPAAASPTVKAQAEQHKKERTAPNQPATANKPASPTPAAKTAAKPASPAPAAAASASKAPSATPATATAQSPSPAAATAQSPAAAAPQPKKLNAQAKKPDPQQVEQIKAQHASFHAQPKPQQVPPVTFNQSYRINGAEQWQGPQYEVYRSYHPEMHDRGWYHSRYPRVELIGGGYYYWNNGYWYPAWGYDQSAQYYAYDAPIYVGHRAEPPDKVIADVQAVLQQQGYYRGEVDGLLGPLTREALTAYQSDAGLYTTAVIDEPTLDSLGMG
jgi:chemotaxis protein histidine kinase CheA